MFRALSTSATGMQAQQLIVDTISNNLANVNTTGFKRSVVDFQDLLYVQLKAPGAEEAAGLETPAGFEIGAGVAPASTLKVFTEGELQSTERDLDVAIEGDGFFQITGPDGEIRYTRDGSFRINSSGQLVNASGYLLEPAISLPADTRTVSIGADGTIAVMAGSSNTPQSVGQITLARFANAAGLSSMGRNLLAETVASGPATVTTPGTAGAGTLQQGFLEKSNVQVVTELVNLIVAQRAYEINARAIRAGDEMLSSTTRLLG